MATICVGLQSQCNASDVSGTVCTGIESPAQCNATGVTPNLRFYRSQSGEMSLEFSVGGMCCQNKKGMGLEFSVSGAEKLYILYGYNKYNSSYPTKYIYGTYYNITVAENRINKLCAKSGFKKSFGTYYSNDGHMTYFINVLPIGDQCTELFTT